MPSRRKTRLASRAKPLLPKDTDNVTMEEDKRKAKLEAYLKDFDIEVEKRIAEMQRLCGTMCSQIQSASNMYLLRLPREIKKMKQVDYFAQSGFPTSEKVIEEISKTVDEMVCRTLPNINQIASASSSSETEDDASCSAAADTDCSEMSTGRKTRTTRKKAATARKKETTAKRTSSRKRNRPALQETPAHQDNTSSFQTPANTKPLSIAATPFITPKFDPNSKMTPASVRRAKKGELLVSLSGSPVEARNSPKEVDTVEKLKENMEDFFTQDRALNEMDRKNILMLQETLTRMLKEKTKVEPKDA